MDKIVKLMASLVLIISVLGVFNSTSVSAATSFIKPNDGSYTSYFGMRQLSNESEPDLHAGVDIGANGSSLNIKASASGTVSRVVYNHSGLGNYIILRHTISGKTYDTLYAHLSSVSVSTGQTVTQGSKIGVMGNTGNSFGVHLHFEMHPNGYGGNATAVDPLPYLTGAVAPTPSYHTYDGTWATLTVETSDGSKAANLFGNPGYGLIGSVSNGSTHSVYVKEKGSDGYNYFAIGNGYINETHARVKTYRATVDYSTAVNVYSAPNGTYKKRVNPGETYNVYGAVGGWYDLGQSTWIKAEYVKVLKP